VQLGQATSQLCQRTGIDDVRHRLRLSTGTQIRVDLLPPLPAATAMTLCSVEAIQERPLSSREVKTSLSDCGVSRFLLFAMKQISTFQLTGGAFSLFIVNIVLTDRVTVMVKVSVSVKVSIT